MSALNFKDLKKALSSNPNVQKLVENLKNLSEDLISKEDAIRGRFDKEKTLAVKQALVKYKEVVKAINDVEKNIAKYKKVVVAQKAKVEKSLFGAKKATTKKVAKVSTKKTATKKVAKVKAKKVSKKSTSKKA